MAHNVSRNCLRPAGGGGVKAVDPLPTALHCPERNCRILMNKGSVRRLFLISLSRRFISRFESLISSHHSRFTCECKKEDIQDDA